MKPLNKRFAPKSTMPEKVIQFGDGNFLRAFVDWIIWHMDQSTNFNGSVVVVQPLEKGMADRLNAQDCLYHVNLQGEEKGKSVNIFERVDVISRALNPYTQNAAFMSLADQPEIRFVVSNTSEAGIAFDPSCKLDDAPASSYPGKLVQLLYRRWNTFKGDPSRGLLIFPCELVTSNGHVLRDCIIKYMDQWKLPKDFKEWFNSSCGVYSTLVDRIVAGFPEKDKAQTWEQIGYCDELVVRAETFHLWVIEAPREVAREFPADRAGLRVLFVPSEEPYHQRKVALLNGPHTLLSPVAFLSGIDIVRDACNDEVISKYIHKVQFDELMQTLDLPVEQLKKFADEVLERFSNPFVDHRLTYIMRDSFPKFRARCLPGLKTYLERIGTLPKGIVFGLAAIIVYYKGGKRVDGVVIEPQDSPDIVDMLGQLWSTGNIQEVTDGVLGAKSIWNEDLNKIPGLNEAVKQDIEIIASMGTREAVKTVL